MPTPYVNYSINGRYVALPVYRNGILVNVLQGLTLVECLDKLGPGDAPGAPAILNQGQTYEAAFGVRRQDAKEAQAVG